MSARRRIPGNGPLVLDSGAVLAFVSGDRDLRQACQDAVRVDFPIVLPTAVYAQVERGGRRAHAARQSMEMLLGLCEVAPLSLEVARQVGWLLGDSETNDVVDAVVVVEALNRDGSVIITSDIGDIQHLLSFGPNRTRRNVRVLGP